MSILVGAIAGTADRAVLGGVLMLFGRREQRRQRQVAALWVELDEDANDEAGKP